MARLSSSFALMAAAAFAGLSQASFGALSNPGLTGTTQYDNWYSFSSSNYPGTGSFPGTTMWSPIASPDGGDGLLIKVSNGTGGGPYIGSGSIYFGGFSGDANINGGTLAVSDSTPVSGLQTVAFQIKIGEATTYDFYNDALPTLTLTFADSSTQTIAATYSAVTEKIYNGTVTMPTGEEPLYINTYLLLWNLSDISGEIAGISVSFTGVQHAQVYDLRLDQSDVNQAASVYASAVPEPAAISLLALGAGAMFLRRRR